MKKVLTLAAMVVAILVLASACTGDQGPPGEQGSAGGEGPPGEATRPAGLPDGVQQLTPTIPGMGEHWANPENMPLGPIHGVYQGQLVFREYMYTQDMLEERTVVTPEGEVTFKELVNLSVGAPVDHMDISFEPEGHEGFAEAHWDIHAYSVPHEEHLAYTP